MFKIKKLISEHWGAWVLAFVIGLAILLPTIVSIEKLGPNWKGIYPTFNDDEYHYLAMVREVADGHASMGNPYIKELKSTPYTQPFLADIYYADFARVFHISIPAAAAANDFILPFISVLLLYAFIFRLTRSKKISFVSSALFFVFFLGLFNRPVNPQFSFIFLLLGLHLIWSVVDLQNSTKKIVIYNLLLSMVFGILVYVYPFYWMTLAVVYGGLSLGSLWFHRDFMYWLKNWISFFVPAVIWSIPFLLNLHKLTASPLFQQTNLRNGYINTHIPGAFMSVGPLFLCLLILYVLQRASREGSTWENKKLVFLGWVLAFGGIILNWQNVVTGEALQFSAHLFPVVVMFVFVIGAILFAQIEATDLNRVLSYKKVALIVWLCMFVVILHIQIGSIIAAVKNVFVPPNISSVQADALPMQWLDANTPPDSAIYTLGDDYDNLIPVYTSDNIYFRHSVGIFLMSDDELENRWVIEHFFDTVDQSVVYGNSDIWLDKYIDTYQSKEVRRKILQTLTGKTYPETTLMDQASVDRVLQKYAQFKKEGFEKALKTYAADYILIDLKDPKYQSVEKTLSSYPFLISQIKTDSFEIFKVQ